MIRKLSYVKESATNIAAGPGLASKSHYDRASSFVKQTSADFRTIIARNEKLLSAGKIIQTVPKKLIETLAMSFVASKREEMFIEILGQKEAHVYWGRDRNNEFSVRDRKCSPARLGAKLIVTNVGRGSVKEFRLDEASSTERIVASFLQRRATIPRTCAINRWNNLRFLPRNSAGCFTRFRRAGF